MAKLLRNTDDLGPGTYYIYGAGGISTSIQKRIADARNDLTFKGYLTSFESTEKATNIQAVKDNLTTADQIIVANQFSREIIHNLQNHDLPCSIFDAIMLVFPWPRVSLSDEESNAFQARTEAISQSLSSERSRTIYRFLTNFRANNVGANPEQANLLFSAFMDEHYGTDDRYARAQYFEYGPAQPFRATIEGGANLGLISKKILEKSAPDGCLYSFEPLYSEIGNATHQHPVHQHLAAEAQSGRYTIVEKALWSEERQLYFDRSTDNLASAHAALTGKETNRVDATSINHFVTENNLSNLDFIKLDVEGAEPEVLKGAINTIAKLRPTMAISIYHRFDQILSIPEYLLGTIDDYQFEVGHHSNSPWLETVLYCLPNERVK